jgi:alkylhydroperoxidase family enzyme
VSRCDIDALHTHGYSDEQILEAILVVGLAKYANYVSFGLGTVPDFNVSSVVQQHSQVASP